MVELSDDDCMSSNGDDEGSSLMGSNIMSAEVLGDVKVEAGVVR